MVAQEKALRTVLFSSLKLTTQLVSTIGQASCGMEGWLTQGFLTGRRGEYSAVFLKTFIRTGPGLLIPFARWLRGWKLLR